MQQICLFLLALMASVLLITGCSPGQRFSGPLTISYAEAANWLENIPTEDQEDQIQDWTILGLARLLNLDLEVLRDNFYDKTPIRSSLFTDLTTNRVGPGRSLPDEEGNLHIIISANDPYPSRTIGMVLDDYRKDSSVDPDWIFIYRYQIDRKAQQVTLEPEAPLSLQAVREQHGFREMQVDTMEGLERFLEETQHLSQLELRNDKLWATGWNWPGTPAGQVTVEDVTVLQRGYRKAALSAVPLTTSDLTTDFLAQPDLMANSDQAVNFINDWINAKTDEQQLDVLSNHVDFLINIVLPDKEAEQLLSDWNPNGPEDETSKWAERYVQSVYTAFDDTPVGQSLMAIAKKHAAERQTSEPGFSLDPGRILSVSDLLNIIEQDKYPSLAQYPEMVNLFVSFDRMGTSEEIYKWLFNGSVLDQFYLPSDVQEIEASIKDPSTGKLDESLLSWCVEVVLNEAATLLDDTEYQLGTTPDEKGNRIGTLLFYTAWRGKSPYQVARYDGGLKGTAAGMTYFYTDIVAKAWPKEKGVGAPNTSVAGFVPDTQAKTPWGHCKTEDEEGRLWFGLREEAVSPRDKRVDLGSITTRVFTLINDPENGDREIEPSYSFGRMIWWWDRHYLAMADYEPQYHRLDQLMRWGTAIAWLVDQKSVLLPEIPDDQIKDDWRFGDWLAAHPDLKWKFDIPFVEPPDEPTEAVLTLFSRWVEDCGTTWTFSGGISNPALKRISQIKGLQPRGLDPRLLRAGLSNEGTTYLATNKAGVIADLNDVTRTLNPIKDDFTTILTTAPGRKVLSWGPLKISLPETTPRTFSLDFSFQGGGVSQKVKMYGLEVGDFSVATKEATVATVSWQPKLLDRVSSMADTIQGFLARPNQTLADAVLNIKGNFPVYYTKGSGRAFIGFEDSGRTYWLMIEEGKLPPLNADDAFSLRLGAPGNAEEGFVAYTGQLVDDAPLPGKNWVKITDGNGLLGSSPSIVKIEQPLGQAKDFAKLVKEGVVNPENTRGPPVYMETRLANQVLEEGMLIPPGGIGAGYQVKFVTVEIAGDGTALTSAPDLITASGREWIRPLGTGNTVGKTIVLVYSADDCVVEQGNLNCKEIN